MLFRSLPGAQDRADGVEVTRRHHDEHLVDLGVVVQHAEGVLEQRLARRRAYFAEGKDKGFDEDDDFWTRGLATWAEEQALPTLEEARKLVSGLFVELVGQITTEDAKKIRELVRNAAIRDDRKLTPREIEVVASAAEQIVAALAPLRAEQAAASGSKKEIGRAHV